MPFRKRNAPTKLDLPKAKHELERARGAIQYWKEQQSSAIEDIASMEGFGGWIARLTGSREENLREAHAKVAVCKQKLKAEGVALKKVQARIAEIEKENTKAKHADDERSMDLELVAEEIRDSDHSLAADLDQLENQLDQVGKELLYQQNAVAAAGALVASMGSLSNAHLQAQSSILGPLTNSGPARKAVSEMPQALARFHAACIQAGVEPLNIRIPGLDVTSLLDDPAVMALRNLGRSIEDLMMALKDERETITHIQLQIAGMRRTALDHQKSLHAQRRALLETADQTRS